MSDAPRDRGHLDLDGLADVLAGELDDPHLRTCRSCADRLAELAAADASVTSALGALPAPPLPAGLSARLAQALEQERRREVATVRPLRRSAPRRSAGWLQAAAASAVLVMAGAAGWSLLDGAGTGASDQSASEAGGDEGGGDEGGGGGGEGEPAAPEAATGLAAPPAPTDWADEAARPAALARLLTDPAAATDTAAAPAVAGLDRLRDPAARDACLTALPGGAGDVLAVDEARYAGSPALAVVQDAGPGSVEVTVVGSGCSAADPQVRLEVVLPRP